MMRYRAILIDPRNASAERPLQIFGNDLPTVKVWAQKVVAGAVGLDARVDILEIGEVKIEEFRKPKAATLA